MKSIDSWEFTETHSKTGAAWRGRNKSLSLTVTGDTLENCMEAALEAMLHTIQQMWDAAESESIDLDLVS